MRDQEDYGNVVELKMGNEALGARELVPGKIYLFNLNILYMEDIVLDMRDRIVQAL